MAINPDHVFEARDGRFDFQCEGCEVSLDVMIEFEPEFYPTVVMEPEKEDRDGA